MIFTDSLFGLEGLALPTPRKGDDASLDLAKAERDVARRIGANLKLRNGRVQGR